MSILSFFSRSSPTSVSDSSPLPVSAAAGGPVDFAPAPPSVLTADTDAEFTFARQARHILLQNNSGDDVNLDFDTVATAGSYLIKAGQERAFDLPCTAIHLLSAGTPAVNGASAGGIVLRGWS